MLEIEANTSEPSPWDAFSPDDPDIVRPRRRKKIHPIEEERMIFRDDPDQLGAALRSSLARLDRWFTVQYGQQMSTGMASSHAIYEQVINRVVSTNEPRQAQSSLEGHIDNLVDLSKESTVFDNYGLSSPMNVDSIIHSLRNASANHINVLEPLLSPYIDTVKARFSALREIHQTIDTFITQTNTFLRPKRVTYRVGEGLQIHSPHDQRLNPTELSSGERHLLLIMSSAVLARNARTLFIIDEPEISLNTTWQKGFGRRASCCK